MYWLTTGRAGSHMLLCTQHISETGTHLSPCFWVRLRTAQSRRSQEASATLSWWVVKLGGNDFLRAIDKSWPEKLSSLLQWYFTMQWPAGQRSKFKVLCHLLVSVQLCGWWLQLDQWGAGFPPQPWQFPTWSVANPYQKTTQAWSNLMKKRLFGSIR